MTTWLYQLETTESEKVKRFSSATSWLKVVVRAGENLIESVITQR
jgi:hypothetical protein